MGNLITVLPFERSFVCEDGESMLEAALRQGLFLRYGCRHGGCGTCKAVLTVGDVIGSGSTFALSPSEESSGLVLLCSSRPTNDCVIDVEAMELSEEEFEAGDKIGKFDATVVDLEVLTPDTRGLRLELDEPSNMAFTAGQFINVEVPGTMEVRSYSIASAPQTAGTLDLIIKLMPGGLFSDYLESRLSVGDRLRLFGPLGALKLRLSHRKVLMVAGGSGLAPFLSILADMERKGRPRPVDLIFGARKRKDLYRGDEIERFVHDLGQVTFTPALSEPDGEHWSGDTGLVTEVISRRYSTLEGYDAYLAGPPPMIDAALPLLTTLGVRPQNIYFDAFVTAVP